MPKLHGPNIITVYRSSICATVLLDKEEIGAIYEICKMPSNQNGTSGIFMVVRPSPYSRLVLHCIDV